MELEHPPLTPEEEARAKFLEDYAALMSGTSDRGATFRRWLDHLMRAPNWCGIDRYGANVDNPNTMYVESGHREIGMMLNQTAIAVAPERYKQMLDEAINLKTQRELRAIENEKKQKS